MNMKRLLVYFALAALVFTACKTIQYVPVETIKEVHIKDSVYFRDTLVRVELEKARLSDFCDVDDTLVLSTDLARSTAYLDTTSGKLRGTLENIKKYVEKEVPLKEKIMYRDSIVYQDKPVPVEVPKPYVPWPWKAMSVVGLLALAWIALKLFVLK